jgi:hypothetical protein
MNNIVGLLIFPESTARIMKMTEINPDDPCLFGFEPPHGLCGEGAAIWSDLEIDIRIDQRTHKSSEKRVYRLQNAADLRRGGSQ